MSWPLLASSVTCSPRAFHSMVFRSTTHGARAGQCAVRMVVLWANTGRASPRAVEQGLDRTSTTVVRWHGLQKVLSTAFNPVARDLRAFASCRTGRPPRSTLRAVRTWCGCVEAQRETRSSPRHRLGLNRTNTATGRRHGLRNFVVTAFGSRGARPAHSPPCGEYRPTVHEGRAAQCVFGVGCVVGQREERSSPSRWLMLDCTNTPTGRRHRLWNVVAAAREFRDVQSARFPLHGVSVDNPRSTGRAVRSSHGCVVGQHRARFSPHRRTGVDRTSTTVGRWHGLREVLSTAFNPVARDLCAFAS